MIDVLILGAGGILGQHLQVSKGDRDAKFARRTPTKGFLHGDLSDHHEVMAMLEKHQPRAIVNLAGENRVDVVEGGSMLFGNILAGLPYWLADWCQEHDSHLVQVSTQAVFDGGHPPYGPDSKPKPYLNYGALRFEGEKLVQLRDNWTIARVTFVLGVRPFPEMGRANPLELMFEQQEQRQVNDRFFSISFAKDVAAELWELAETKPGGILHLGIPERRTRYEIAKIANPTANIAAVSDDEFTGPRRPKDTTWAPGSLYRMSLEEGIEDARRDWEALHAK
jgi:dTDP-4-dehydrorhamnose reductase